MFEKAEEIQKLWKPKDGDRFFWKSYNSPAGGMKVNRFHIVGIGETEKIERWWNCIWLPTQEQLITILNEVVKNNWNLTYWENDKMYNLYCLDIGYTNEDVRIVFLEMIMKKKYHKFWTGKDWR